MSLSQAYLRWLLRYDPSTGLFHWRVWRSQRPPGLLAGHLDKGYIRIKIDGKSYRAHRLAWLYMTGEMPKSGMDHKNLDGTDNRWDNLRLASASQNNANKKARVGKAHPLKGAYFDPSWKRWRAQIAIGGRSILLGGFDSAEQAHAAYAKAANDAFGEFARAA